MRKIEECIWEGIEALFGKKMPVLLRNVIPKTVLEIFTVDELCKRIGHMPVKVAVTDKGLVRFNVGKGHYYDDLAQDTSFEKAMKKIASEVVPETYIPRMALDNDSEGRVLMSLLPYEGAPKEQALLTSTLWAGPAGNKMPMHHDFADNMFCQLVGKKRFVLLSPEYELKTHRLPFDANGSRPMWHSTTIKDVAGEISQLRNSLPLDSFYEVTMNPGDVLWLPNLWWHEVTSLDTPTISAASWWSTSSMGSILGKIEDINRYGIKNGDFPEGWKESF